MEPQSIHFKQRVASELANAQLQSNLRRFGGRFKIARAKVVGEVDDWEGTRTAAAEARDRALNNLDTWIDRFEREATRRGATVLFAETGADVAELVNEICRRHGVKKVTKS
jgi:L-lactate dehydrogenase complex protein LldF